MNSGQGLLCLHHLTSFSVHTFPKCSFQEYQIRNKIFLWKIPNTQTRFRSQNTETREALRGKQTSKQPRRFVLLNSLDDGKGRHHRQRQESTVTGWQAALPACSRGIPTEEKIIPCALCEIGPGKDVQLPSWETFKTQLDKTLSKLQALLQVGAWTNDHKRSLLISFSVILAHIISIQVLPHFWTF